MTCFRRLAKVPGAALFGALRKPQSRWGGPNTLECPAHNIDPWHGRCSAAKFRTGSLVVISQGRTARRDLRTGAALHRKLHRPPSSRCNSNCVQKCSSFPCRFDICALGRDLTLQCEISSGGDHRIRAWCQFLRWHIAIHPESLKRCCNFSANRPVG